MGVFNAGRKAASQEGSATFLAAEVGSYVISVKSASPQAEIDVTVNYEIGE